MTLLNILTWAFGSAFNIAHTIGLILAIVLFCLQGKQGLYWVKAAAFLLLCACELYGFNHRSGDPTWFLSSIKDFFLGLLYIVGLFGVLFIQFRSMLDLLQESQYNGRFHCQFLVGYLGMIAAVVAWIVLSFMNNELISYAAYILVISQVVQLVIVIVAAIHQQGSILYALFSFVIYAVGVVSLVYSLIQLMLMAIIAVMIIGALKGFATGAAKGAVSSGKETEEYDTIAGPGGGLLYGDRIDRDHFVSSGIHYRRTYDGLCEVWEEED